MEWVQNMVSLNGVGTKHDKFKMEWVQNMMSLNGVGTKHDKLKMKWYKTPNVTKRPLLQNAQCYKIASKSK